MFKENLSIEIAEAEAAIKLKIKMNLMQYSKTNFLSFDETHKNHGNCGSIKKSKSTFPTELKGLNTSSFNSSQKPKKVNQDAEAFLKSQQDLARRMTLNLNLKNNISFLKSSGVEVADFEKEISD